MKSITAKLLNNISNKISQYILRIYRLIQNDNKNENIFIASKEEVRAKIPIAMINEALNKECPNDWDYPTNIAISETLQIIKYCIDFKMIPSKVSRSADGGLVVYIESRSSVKYALFEIYPDGDIVAGFSNGNGIPHVWDMRFQKSEAFEALHKFDDFFNMVN